MCFVWPCPADGKLYCTATAFPIAYHCILKQAIYGKAVAVLKDTNGYAEVLAIPDDRPEVKQANDDFKNDLNYAVDQCVKCTRKM